MNERLRKDQPATFGSLIEEELPALDALINYLISPSVFALPNSGGRMTLQTDVCYVRVVFVLIQKQPAVTVRPIGYPSQSLNDAAIRYYKTRREYLVIFRLVLLLHDYLKATCITIQTDHSSPKRTLNFADSTGDLDRWRLCLYKFEINVVHRERVKHQSADALWRLLTTGLSTSTLEKDLLLLTLEAWHTGKRTDRFICAHECVTSQNTTTQVVVATPK